ncbi:LuxR C-terminal-related transcriptional regulator [Epilithonimonas zeae]|uniref:DNA-binding response regulator, NarL/FixJ family, contains REC and HTH domains n=1 Tax=Epilithonimonas zeae TaxID=1416779 RepID=A0A1N6EGJ1_9FLAO|nr:response regulator transcription factor [Epilithonimonas zeae]SIN82148.1 DNA-binding response regulator, NarL/FixJ family, contains REC and HTH domains [Epilithonimonas zeae]
MKPKLIIFDEPLFYTEGLSKLLTQGDIFSNISICTSTETLYECIKNSPPDFLLLGANSLVLTEMYVLVENLVNEYKDIKIITIGNFYEVSKIRKLFEKGIKSYLDINCCYNEFVKSIEALSSDLIYICDFAKERMINFISHKQNNQNDHADCLTKREMEVLKLICDGLSSKQICEKLFISINTVETHRKKILLKLNVKNSAGVVKYAIENHIIE